MKGQVFNPYLPADRCVPDGEPHVFGDRVYLYGSHDEEGGSAFCVLDYEVFSAPVDDLSAWRSEGIAYRKEQDPDYAADGYNAMYAPDVVRGNDGKYYLYYAMAGGHFTGPLHVAVSDSPTGPFEYYGEVRNPDGTVFHEGITFDPGVINDDGVIRLYYGWSLSIPKEVLIASGAADPGCDAKTNPLMVQLKNIEMQMFEKSAEEIENTKDGIMGANVVVLDDDMLTVKEGPKRIVPGSLDAIGTQWEDHAFFEASSIRKVNGRYYFIYSSEQMHELCYAVSEHPDRDFKFGGTLVSNGDLFIGGREKKDALAAIGNNHGSIECIDGQWYVFYHRHTHKTSFSRQGCAEKITILPDGTIPQVRMTSCGLNGGPLRAEGTYGAAIACVLSNGNMAEWETNAYEGRTGKQVPYLTSQGEERYITEITNGTVIGFRSFELSGNESLSVMTRGDMDGSFIISYELPAKIGEGEGQSLPADIAAQIPVTSSTDWSFCSAALKKNAGCQKTAVYLIFQGKGKGDLLSISFAEKGEAENGKN